MRFVVTSLDRKYFLIGLLNTLVSYCVGLLLSYVLLPISGQIIFFATLFVLASTFSFATQSLFVFHAKPKFFAYLKFLLGQVCVGVFGILAFNLTLYMGMPNFVSVGSISLSSAVASFFISKFFVFGQT